MGKPMKPMKDREMVIDVDIDDTLIIYEPTDSMTEEDAIFVKDPYMNSDIKVYPHRKHIAIMKRMYLQGYFVCVRSQGGAQWAEAVINALELQDYKDIIMAKPSKYLDDLPVEAWMGQRLYFKPD